MKLLWVDSDVDAFEKLAPYFCRLQFQMEIAPSKRLAMQKILTFHPDCMISEYALPDGNGLDICYRVRAYSNMPFLFLTGAVSEKILLQCFEAGADDCLEKPCSPKELYVRIRRRMQAQTFQSAAADENEEVKINNLVIQIKSRRIFLNGKEIELTPIEFNILLLMTEHLNQTVPIDTFYKKFWSSEELRQTSRVLQTHMSNLRKKLKFNPCCNINIVNIYGKGYGLSVAEAKSEKA